MRLAWAERSPSAALEPRRGCPKISPPPRAIAAMFSARFTTRSAAELTPAKNQAQVRQAASKENGIDIEGMVVLGNRALFGLRGPVIGGSAVVVEVLIREGLQIDNRAFRLHFLNLARWRAILHLIAAMSGRSVTTVPP